jgi:hypothetical protein
MVLNTDSPPRRAGGLRFFLFHTRRRSLFLWHRTLSSIALDHRRNSPTPHQADQSRRFQAGKARTARVESNKEINKEKDCFVYLKGPLCCKSAIRARLACTAASFVDKGAYWTGKTEIGAFG